MIARDQSGSTSVPVASMATAPISAVAPMSVELLYSPHEASSPGPSQTSLLVGPRSPVGSPAPDRAGAAGVGLDAIASSSTEVQEVQDPATLVIPSIDVESRLNPLGLNADGTLEVPARGPLYDQAGWFTGSPRPGQTGPAVLLGHVNGRGGVPSVFFRLGELRAGDLVTVDRPDGSKATFEVYLTEQYAKDQFPTVAVYGDTSGPELRLITCAGVWDAAVDHYRDNTVVYARLVPAK